MLQRGPREQPAGDLRIGGLQVQRHIRGHAELDRDQVQRAGLLHVPRDPVQDISPARRPGRDHRLPHHVQHDLVRDEVAAIEKPLDGQTQAGPPRHMITQQLTRRDVGNAEMRGDQRTLRALARPRRRDHQYPHPHLPSSSSRPPPARSVPPAGRQPAASPQPARHEPAGQGRPRTSCAKATRPARPHAFHVRSRDIDTGTLQPG